MGADVLHGVRAWGMKARVTICWQRLELLFDNWKRVFRCVLES